MGTQVKAPFQASAKMKSEPVLYGNTGGAIGTKSWRENFSSEVGTHRDAQGTLFAA